ncbi:hypothetical protein PGT21_036792 [Puccinia graminis f. sp. tritici]|uniref:Uncharacterized protein n=1 Tax=Puccinia graminis f. sp. tritici TaxID=56615 RepID=A0A5B0QDG0_PUCGR|nr:hypothetical protein PGT21_036792 [Puccinia graminis f. sp. tritici]
MLIINCYTLSFIGFYNLINYAFTSSYPLEIAPAPDGRLLLTGATKFSQDLTKRQNRGTGTTNTRPRPAGTTAATQKAATTGGSNKSLKLREAARRLNTEANQVTKGLQDLKKLNPQSVPAAVDRIMKIVAAEAGPRDEIGKALPNNSAVQSNVAAIKKAGPSLGAAIRALKTGGTGANFSKQVDKVLEIRKPTLEAVKSIIGAADAASK